MSSIPRVLRPPAKLAAPAVAALISAASFALGVHLGSVMAILPWVVALGAGLTALIWLMES